MYSLCWFYGDSCFLSLGGFFWVIWFGGVFFGAFSTALVVLGRASDSRYRVWLMTLTREF